MLLLLIPSPQLVIYDPEILQVVSGTGSTSTLNVTFSPTKGDSILLLFVASDTTKTGDPAGWTVPTGGAQDGAMQLYGWYRETTGAEDAVTVDLAASASSAWVFVEVNRLGDLDTSAGQFANTSGASYDTPTVSPTIGRRFGFAAVGGRRTASQANSFTAWGSTYSELADVVQQAATSITLGVANLAFDSLEAGTTGTTGVFANSVDSRTSMIMVFKGSDVIEDWVFGWTVQVGA
jgi:hypothetical protein